MQHQASESAAAEAVVYVFNKRIKHIIGMLNADDLPGNPLASLVKTMFKTIKSMNKNYAHAMNAQPMPCTHSPCHARTAHAIHAHPMPCTRSPWHARTAHAIHAQPMPCTHTPCDALTAHAIHAQPMPCTHSPCDALTAHATRSPCPHAPPSSLKP